MIENGKYVLVHYTGTFDSGEVFDSSEGRDPLEFQLGTGSVIPGFEDAIKEMSIDEEKSVHIKAADAYGEYDETMTQNFPLEEVKKVLSPEVGLTVVLQGPHGEQVPVIIKEITDSEVVLDLNPPLAGKDLNFKIKLVGVNDEPTQECSEDDCGSCDCGCGHDH